MLAGALPIRIMDEANNFTELHGQDGAWFIKVSN